MDVTDIVARLPGAKANGPDRWVARCPAHKDRSPSLTVRGLPDGRVLLHCFAGCEPQTVLDAIGLEFTDLFPEPLTRERLPRIAAPFSPMDALRCLTAESAIIAFSASDLAQGKPVDADRVARAAGRIATALEAIHA